MGVIEMPQCIFCKSKSSRFSTREHILPESLGGGDWAVLNDGLLCDVCQNRFGSDVEQKALGDYPFSFFRVFLGVPTKKRKAPWLVSWEGELHADDVPGTLGYKPAPYFLETTERRKKTVMRIVAEPTRPKMVCRMLLKMAIEVIANDNSSDVFHERYDSARTFALTRGKAVHSELAMFGEVAHQKVVAFLRANPQYERITSRRLGRLRSDIKKHIEPELKVIDQLVSKIVV